MCALRGRTWSVCSIFSLVFLNGLSVFVLRFFGLGGLWFFCCFIFVVVHYEDSLIL